MSITTNLSGIDNAVAFGIIGVNILSPLVAMLLLVLVRERQQLHEKQQQIPMISYRFRRSEGIFQSSNGSDIFYRNSYTDFRGYKRET
jgi:hypothetical protein